MMQAECDVCGSSHSPDVNQIIFCDGLGCDIPVHQKCYNVDSIPDGPWYCKRCADNTVSADKVPIFATSVVCCQQKNGALLRTSIKREYIHAVCAYWNPKISKQSDVIKVDPRLFAKKGCTICGIPNGLTVGCSKSGCSREFHVTCALDTKILDRTLKDFCNTDKLKCPKHFAIMAKENIKEPKHLYHDNSFQHSLNASRIEIRDYKPMISKPQPVLTKPVEEVKITDCISSKRNAYDKIDRVERKMFKAASILAEVSPVEKGGTFKWLAEKISSIKKAAEAIGNLSPEFKAEIDKLNLPSLSEIPLKRYSQDSSNEKEYQDIQKKYITAQEEINELQKEVGRLKDAHQSERKKLDSLKQSLFRLLKFFDLSDRFIVDAPSDVENALSMICKELDK